MITIKALHPKNQSKVNKAVKALLRYYELNNLRDNADGEGNEKDFKKYDRMCEQAYDRYYDYLTDLPKREQANIEKQDN
jgi:hypothetical protein